MLTGARNAHRRSVQDRQDSAATASAAGWRENTTQEPSRPASRPSIEVSCNAVAIWRETDEMRDKRSLRCTKAPGQGNRGVVHAQLTLFPILSGLSWDKDYSKLHVSINFKGTKISNLGSYNNEEEAAKRYDEVAQAIQEKPILNWLPDGTLNPNRKRKGSGKQLR